MASIPPTNIPPGPSTPVSSGRPGFNIDRFKTNLSNINGPLKPSSYVMAFSGSGFDSSIQYLTERVELPDVSLDTEKIRRYGYGPLEDVPYRPVFQPLRVTIIVPSNNKIGIVELVNKLSGTAPFNTTDNNPYSMASTNLNVSDGSGSFSKTASPYEVAYKKDITFDTQVSLFSVEGNKLITYNFNQCFLRSMSPIDLSWSATDQYVKVDMTIGYTDFYLT